MWFLDRGPLTERFWHRHNVVGGHVSLDQDGWTIELVFADIDGRTECVGLAIIGDGTQPITSSKLRKFPLTRLVQGARRRAVTATPDKDINIEMWTGSVPGIHQEPLQAIKNRIAEGLTAPERGRQWYDAEHYQRVADAYDFAIENGLNTTEHVQEALSLSTPGQARKHVWRARHTYGFLPPTHPRIKKGNEQ